MNGHEHSKIGRDTHAFAQGCVVDMRKVADAAVAHECFQADNAAVSQRF